MTMNYTSKSYRLMPGWLYIVIDNVVYAYLTKVTFNVRIYKSVRHFRISYLSRPIYYCCVTMYRNKFGRNQSIVGLTHLVFQWVLNLELIFLIILRNDFFRSHTVKQVVQIYFYIWIENKIWESIWFILTVGSKVREIRSNSRYCSLFTLR